MVVTLTIIEFWCVCVCLHLCARLYLHVCRATRLRVFVCVCACVTPKLEVDWSVPFLLDVVDHHTFVMLTNGLGSI